MSTPATKSVGQELVSGAHARLEIEPGQQWWTEAQIAALNSIGLDNVPQGDAIAFLHLCQRTGLDPFAREIHLVGRKVDGKMKYTPQTGIDGYRHVAQRTNTFRGTEGPWWCGTDGRWSEVWFSEEPPVAAKAVVKRLVDGEIVRTEAVVMYREFVATKPVWGGSDGRQKVGEAPAAMWAKMPAHMTGKCAEALAFRRAFPRELNGTYIAEEVVRMDVDAENAEHEQQQADRARIRREYVRRPWDDQGPAGSGESANLADVAPGDVVPGEVTQPAADEEVADTEPDRDELLAELDVIADLLGTTPTALATRAIKLHRKNLEDFDGWQLDTLVESYRPQAEEAARNRTQSAVEAVAESTSVPAAEEPAAAPEEDAEARAAREAQTHARARARARGTGSTETAAERAARHAAEAAAAPEEEPPTLPVG